ncbi:MAG: hypothetical protein ACFFFK_07665 [Candidatus Thorarchaeota archaeon]
MSEEKEYVICTSKDRSVCVACEIDGKLNCRFDEDLVKCFRNRHIPYRTLQLFVAGVTSFLIGVWWPFLLFSIILILNFTIIETRYLCRHCPFYEKEGGSLECITLKGLPRLWKFDPSPMKTSDKIGMTLVGGFIDVFPILWAGYSVWVLYSINAELLSIISMIGLTIVSIIAAGYLEEFIGKNYCKRCVNLSCMMNKVPKELKDEFLQKNPEMLKIWESCGYVIGNMSTEKQR